jgi:YegS/Rv2252/BmrU family lipid kinase
VQRKFLLLVNPVSGRKNGELHAVLVSNRLESEGFEVKVLLTSADPEFKDKVRNEWDESITDLIAMGGDGTLNLAVNILHNKKVHLNIIANGNGNDFVKNINLGKSFEEQLETIVSGELLTIDVGMCNDQLFLNGLGLGFDGQIAYDNLNRKSIFSGHAKYYSQVLRILATYIPQKIMYSIDGEVSSDHIILLMVANGTTFGGGFKLTPDANVSDGQLDICLIRQIAPLRRFWEVLKLTKGTHGVLEAVDITTGKEVFIKGNETIKAQIDGEFFGAPPYHIKVLPNHLKVRVRV